MSRMGQAVFEGEEFADNNHEMKLRDFNRAAIDQFGGHSVQYEAALAAYLEYCEQPEMKEEV